MSTVLKVPPAEITAILKKTVLFGDIGDDEAYRNLAAICIAKEFRAGEYILTEQEATNYAEVIYEGTARVYRKGHGSSSITLALLGKGDILGELSLLDGGKRSATVEAIEKVRVLELQHVDFVEFLGQNSSVAVELVKLLVRRLRATSQLTEELHTAKLATRTLNTLMTLSRLHDNTKTVIISQEELASIVGASRPRVTEALQELEQDGKISRKWRSITLLI